MSKHSLGFVELIAGAMAPPNGCLCAWACAGSVQVFAAAFVLAVNVAKTTDCLDLQVGTQMRERSILQTMSMPRPCVGAVVMLHTAVPSLYRPQCHRTCALVFCCHPTIVKVVKVRKHVMLSN